MDRMIWSGDSEDGEKSDREMRRWSTAHICDWGCSDPTVWKCQGFCFPIIKFKLKGFIALLASIKKCFSQICWFTWLKVWCVFIGLKGATIDGKKSPGTRTRTHLVRLPDPTPRSEAATSSPTHLLLDIPGSWGTWLGGDSPGTAGFSPPASSTTS